jgi:hypothetical protein
VLAGVLRSEVLLDDDVAVLVGLGLDLVAVLVDRGVGVLLAVVMPSDGDGGGF